MKKKIKVKVLEGTPFLLSEEEEVGRGSFGKVVKAYNREEPSKELVAKIIPLTEENKESILAEIKILKQVPDHENLVNCAKMQISSEHNFYLIMEYCNGGSFETYIRRNNNCSEEIIWRFLREFVRGYQVLYDSHLIHRDIKPENILIHNGKFKIADFGLSRKIDHHNLVQNLSVKGTPLYIAPELQGENKGNSKIDVFSLGIVLYRLAFNGPHPFYDPNKAFNSIGEYFDYLKKIPLKFPKYPKRSEELITLIEKMLEKNPEKRIGWKEIFEHPQIKQKEVSLKNEENPQFTELKQSIVEINRSSAHLKELPAPFNHRAEIGAELDRLIEFTRLLPELELQGLQVYVLRGKVIVELIKHLNGILRTSTSKKGTRLNFILDKIIIEGFIYCLNCIQKIKEIVHKYRSEVELENQESIDNSLDLSLENDRKQIEEILSNYKDVGKYEHLKYENLLYDFLTEFGELKNTLKQELKIPVMLMLDLYDGLLKLESLVKFKENGFIEIVEIELEDAEIDKIDYENLATYQKYLDKVNEVTLTDVENGLKSMGLMIE